ncbi:MAG: PEP-CTERM sorting domain-containing protein [Planctomycetales bacterium]|nr:PEP-CTERM sorting domain-containing protein [Planctomycetales bacterium]
MKAWLLSLAFVLASTRISSAEEIRLHLHGTIDELSTTGFSPALLEAGRELDLSLTIDTDQLIKPIAFPNLTSGSISRADRPSRVTVDGATLESIREYEGVSYGDGTWLQYSFDVASAPLLGFEENVFSPQVTVTFRPRGGAQLEPFDFERTIDASEWSSLTADFKISWTSSVVLGSYPPPPSPSFIAVGHVSDLQVVPEPSSLSLATAAALLGFGFRRVRRDARPISK